MPDMRCPSCGEIVTKLVTDRNVSIVWKDGQWLKSEDENMGVIQCSHCYEELSPEELDELGVPNSMR